MTPVADANTKWTPDDVVERVCAQCKGFVDDLAEGRDPEELCDPCYDDALAALSRARGEQG